MSDNVRLELKCRKADEQIVAPVSFLKELAASGDRDKVFEWVEKITTIRKDCIHDKAWLAMIVNYVPTLDTPQGRQAKQVPLTDQAPWFKLATRVHDLREVGGAIFTLSHKQADLIWKRLNDKEFQLINFSPLFQAFVLDFAAAYGKTFEALSDGAEYDEPVEYPKSDEP